jgi:hypothetical protein
MYIMKNTNVMHFATPTKVFIVACLLTLAAVSATHAQESWKPAFEDICWKVQETDNLSIAELTTLIEKADKLMPVIQASDSPSKKVYLLRLKKCRALFEFIIDTKKSSEK